MSSPDALAFADRRVDGAFAVTEPSGTTVASIRVSRWTGASFEALDHRGEPLCTGRRRSWWSSSWEVVDPAGGVLASVTRSWSGMRKTVALPDGRILTLQGQWFGRDWALRDDQGHDVLSSVPSTSGWTFHPDAWVVRCHDASLTLAHVVGIVETNRLMLKAARAS